MGGRKTGSPARPLEPEKAQHLTYISSLENADLIKLRAALDVEMKRRKIALSVGQMAEEFAIQFFNCSPDCPKLLAAPTGTANVDALSRRGERYSIKGVCNAKKTGTVYPDPETPDKQLFEYLLVVKMSQDWSLEAIYEFDWQTFCAARSWDKRMRAWYIGATGKTLAKAKRYLPFDVV